MLNAQVPLVDVSIVHCAGVQVTGVAITPLRQLAVLRSLRQRQSHREGVAQGRILGKVIVQGEIHVGVAGEGWTRVLKIGGYVHAEEHSGAAAQDRVGTQFIGEAQPRGKVVAIHGRIPVSRSGEYRRTADITDRAELGVTGHPESRDADSGVAGKVAELESVEAL